MTLINALLATNAAAPASRSLTFIEVAMFIFMAIFLGLLIWVIFAKRGTFKRVKQIPLEDDKVVTPRKERKHKS